MKLYYSPVACSLAVHIARREVGASFQARAVDLATHTIRGDGRDYRAISRGYVPLLELDDGSRHTEAAALLQYVAELDRTQALIGTPDSQRRLAVSESLAFVATELHKVFGPWLWDKEAADSTRQAVENKLAVRFAELNALFATRDFIAGDYSVADGYAFAILNWTNVLGLSLAPYSKLRAYLQRVQVRPAVQAAMRAEGLLT
jgi:glutathione S-transferase